MQGFTPVSCYTQYKKLSSSGVQIQLMVIYIEHTIGIASCEMETTGPYSVKY